MPTNAPLFTHNPNRDASDTIRGFVYQVDFTVQRWIALPADDILQLEHGEDIDIVAAAIVAGDDPHRIVEQVKSLTRSVTLRSKATLEAVANFALHRARNPGLRLRFRFTTNAKAGKEQKFGWPGGGGGIAAWSRIAGEHALHDVQTELGKALRSFYRTLNRPKNFPIDAWAALRDLVESGSEDEWLNFLTTFEWSMGNVAPSSIAAQIRADLVARGLSVDAEQATAHHMKLFIHVIRLLSNPGDKRLAASELAGVLASPTDAALASRLETVVAWTFQFEQRLHDVETQIADLQSNASAQFAVAAGGAVDAHRKWSRESYSSFYSVALGRHLNSSWAWDRVRQRSTEDGRTGDEAAEKVLAGNVRLLLVSGAGAGKSTLCRRLAYAAAERDQLVLRISLREVMRRLVGGMTFAQAVADLVPSAEDPAAREAIAGRLDLLLADGFDECGTNRALVAQKLLEWSEAHAQCRIVVTTRAVGSEEELLPDFAIAELRSLDREEARSLASRLLSVAGPGNAVAAWVSLEKVLPRWSWRNSGGVGDAASNPLLLSFLVALAAQGVPLDGTRAEVYSRIVAAIRERGRPDRVPVSEPAEPILRFVFDALGWHLLQDPAADRRTLRERIAPELAAAGGLAPLAAEVAFDNTVEFWRDRGVLDHVGTADSGAVVFVHQSLAEFGAGRRVATFSSSELRSWVEVAIQDERSTREVMRFAAGSGAANPIAAVLLDEQPSPWSIRPLLAAGALAETHSPDAKLLAEVVSRLTERIGSSAPIVAIEAGLAMERLSSSAGAAYISHLRPMLDSEYEWTRLAALAPMLAADPASVPTEVAQRWLHELELVGRISFGDQWTKDRDLPYAAADLQEAALPHAVQLVAERAPQEEARDTFEKLFSHRLGNLITREQLAVILRAHGFGDVEERHRVDVTTTWRSTLEMLERERPLELELLDEIVTALVLPVADGLPPEEGMPNLTRIVRTLHIDWFSRVMAKAQRDVLRDVIRGIASATSVSRTELSREIDVARQHIMSGDARNVFECIEEYEETPDWALGARAVDASVLFRALKHSSDGINLAAANLIAEKGLTENELVDGLRGAIVEGYSVTLHLAAQLALELLPADRAVGLFVDRLTSHSTPGCSHLYEALGKLASKASTERQEDIRNTIAAGLTVDYPDAAASAADVAGMFVPGVAVVSEAVLHAFDYWSVDRGTCVRCKVPLAGDSCPKCRTGVRHPRPVLLRLRDRIEPVPALELLALTNDNTRGVSEVARELLTVRVSEDDAGLSEVIATLRNDSASIRLATRLRALRIVLGLPGARLRHHADALAELLESTVPQVRAAFLQELRSDWLTGERVAQYARRGLADSSPNVRSAAASLARRINLNSE